MLVMEADRLAASSPLPPILQILLPSLTFSSVADQLLRTLHPLP